MKPYLYLILPLFIFMASMGCQQPASQNSTSDAKVAILEPQYSLGQWSFNREHFKGEMTVFDFVKAAGEMNFYGVDYVSNFFKDQVENVDFLDSLKLAVQQANIKSTMILVDNEGNLGASDIKEREGALANHKKWVKAAKHIDCPVIRVNAYGDGTPEEIKAACVDAIGKLAAYAATEGIQIVIENHGGISNSGTWLVDLLQQLKNQNVKGLADFDNWCVERENGKIWGAPCTHHYDSFKGMKELMPYATGVSAKAFEFDEYGKDTKIDFARMFEIIHASGYTGIIGVEYEGDGLPSREGIEKTRALADKGWKGILK